MPGRPSAAKKKSSSPRRKALTGRNAKPRGDAAKVGYYVCVGELNLAVSGMKPKAPGASGPFANAQQARSAAVDALIAAIETAERQLAAVKRATTMDELQNACGAR